MLTELDIPPFLDRRTGASIAENDSQKPRAVSFEQLHKLATGRWVQILNALGLPRESLMGTHVPCPGCGGKDRFRFDDKDGRGTFYCNGGGTTINYGDGFQCLIHTGIAKTHYESLKMVSLHLGLPKPQPRLPSSIEANRVITYDYQNADHELVFTVTRTERSGRKLFSRKTANGLTPKQDPNFRPLPYRLPELLAKPEATVLIVEGEKCVVRLLDLGFTASCNHGGAGNWSTEINKYFKDRKIIILPDNDEAGERHCRSVKDQLRDVAASIRVCHLSGLPLKGDVVDWLDAGNDRDKLSHELSQREHASDGMGVKLADFL